MLFSITNWCRPRGPITPTQAFSLLPTAAAPAATPQGFTPTFLALAMHLLPHPRRLPSCAFPAFMFADLSTGTLETLSGRHLNSVSCWRVCFLPHFRVQTFQCPKFFLVRESHKSSEFRAHQGSEFSGAMTLGVGAGRPVPNWLAPNTSMPDCHLDRCCSSNFSLTFDIQHERACNFNLVGGHHETMSVMASNQTTTVQAGHRQISSF
jgi:hypothetical protein